MAKVVVSIPEPKQEYDVSNQRQILEALDTLKNQVVFRWLIFIKVQHLI